MASLKYFIKGTGNPATIYFRFLHGRQIDFKKSTTLLIDPKYWNNSKGEVRQIAENNDKKNLQNKLNNLKSYILNQFNDSYSSGVTISSEWLANKVNNHFNQNIEVDFNYFTDYAEYYFKNLTSKVLKNGKTGVSASTIKKYRTTIVKVKDFEKYHKIRVKIIDVNLKFHKDFIDFLHNVQKLNFNTTGKYLNFVKTICWDAKKYGLKIHKDLENGELRPPSEKVSFVTLSEDEIQKIFEYNLNDSPYLNNARNWLIIGLWTGARVSDLLNFTNKNIKNDFIEFTAQKTGERIILPLHIQVQKIIEKLHGNFPRHISDQKFNVYIKEVCKRAGINKTVNGSKLTELKKGIWRKVNGSFEKWELLSSHVCRRSFATNHYGELPTPVIMAITGHTTEKMFLNYIGKTAKDNAEVLKQYWKLQENKQQRKPQLNIIKSEFINL